MKTTRRSFLKTATLAGAAAGLPALSASAATSLARPSKMRLGTVTYNLAKDWDIPTIIKHCAAARFGGVELRTTHAHGVEVSLTAAQRKEVKNQFIDSGIELMGLGSAFDYHSPDPSKLRTDIEATKQYIILAHDVGASGVKVRPNGLPKGVPVEKTLEQIGHSLQELGEFGEGYGVQLRLEVHGSGTALLPNIKSIMDVATHRQVGVCWNSNNTDLEGDGFEHNFSLVKNRIISVHMRDLFLDDYPFRQLFARLNQVNYAGYCLAEIPASTDPVRVMKYYRALWLAYQNLL